MWTNTLHLSTPPEPAHLAARGAGHPLDREHAAVALPARIPELDGIRGLAILLVLVWHYWASRVHPPLGSAFVGIWMLCGLTWSGVDLFFVVSRFLIGGVLLEQRDSANYFKTFYVRRVCRIFPILFLVF